MIKSTTSNKLKKHTSTKVEQLEYTHKDIFLFKNGICGFKNAKKFIIAPLPQDTPKHYRYLQSTEDESLKLIIMNITVNPKNFSIINAKDLETSLHLKNLELKDVAIFLVTSMHSKLGKNYISVNTVAPIMLNPVSQEGWQVILDSPAYNVQHYLG
jgi:flagellar assembly factor FliW